MDPKIDRTLNLRNNTDRLYFYGQLEKSKDLPFTFEEIRESIEYISTHLKDDEWLIIYPGVVNLGQTSISHGNLLTRIQIASFKDDSVIKIYKHFLGNIRHESKEKDLILIYTTNYDGVLKTFWEDTEINDLFQKRGYILHGNDHQSILFGLLSVVQIL